MKCVFYNHGFCNMFETECEYKANCEECRLLEDYNKVEVIREYKVGFSHVDLGYFTELERIKLSKGQIEAIKKEDASFLLHVGGLPLDTVGIQIDDQWYKTCIFVAGIVEAHDGRIGIPFEKERR